MSCVFTLRAWKWQSFPLPYSNFQYMAQSRPEIRDGFVIWHKQPASQRENVMTFNEILKY